MAVHKNQQHLNIPSADVIQPSFDVFVMVSSADDNKGMLNRRLHKHNFFELHFMLDGYLGYEFEDKRVKVRGGEFIIIPPNKIHSVCDVPDTFYKMTICVEVGTESSVGKALLKFSDKVISIGDDIRDAAGNLLDAQQSSAGKRNKSIQIRKAIYSVVYNIVGENPCDDNSDGNIVRKDERVLSAKKYIDDNSDKFINCSEVASYCNLSTKQMGRLFKGYEGISLLQYIHNVKIEQSKYLLVHTEESQADIAKRLGFLDAQYFGKFFYRMTGETPCEYRRRKKETLR